LPTIDPRNAPGTILHAAADFTPLCLLLLPLSAVVRCHHLQLSYLVKPKPPLTAVMFCNDSKLTPVIVVLAGVGSKKVTINQQDSRVMMHGGKQTDG
jgi:hypothetical protein